MKKRVLSIILLVFMLVSILLPVLIKNGNKDEPEIQKVPIVFVSTQPVGKEIIETVDVEKLAIDRFYDEMEYLSEIEDKMEWFKGYKEITEKYSYIIDPPETIYDYFSEEELDLLFRVVQAEVGDECYSFEQKANVAGVIFSRIDHEKFPDTLPEILIPGQFSTITNGRYQEVEISDDTILACEYAFQIGSDADGCLFFDSDESLNYKLVFDDDAHNFYTYHREELSDE